MDNDKTIKGHVDIHLVGPESRLTDEEISDEWVYHCGDPGEEWERILKFARALLSIAEDASIKADAERWRYALENPWIMFESMEPSRRGIKDTIEIIDSAIAQVAQEGKK